MSDITGVLVAQRDELRALLEELVSEFHPAHIDAVCSSHTLGSRIADAIAFYPTRAFRPAKRQSAVRKVSE